MAASQETAALRCLVPFSSCNYTNNIIIVMAIVFTITITANISIEIAIPTVCLPPRVQ